MPPPGPAESVGAAAACAAAVVRLDLTEFRNYRTLKLETDPVPVILTGANGAGKTNLLEALSLLGPGRGLRRAALAELARDQGSLDGTVRPFAVAARLVTPNGPLALGTGVEAPADGAPARRAVRVDGAAVASQAALAEHLALVWLTPEMDRLFADAPGGRRRFLDRLVYGFDPAHGTRIAAYERSLRERARLLRDGTGDGTWLDALEETLAAQAIAVAAARAETVARLADVLDEREGGSGEPFPRPALTLAGTVDQWLRQETALAAEERLRTALADARAADAAAGRASHGPHRSDLVVHHVGHDVAAARCSTGEQKALLLAIVLAFAQLLARARGAPPLLLLDEVAAHLDAARRGALFERISALGAQAWLTGTEPRLFEPLRDRAQFCHVEAANVSRDVTP